MEIIENSESKINKVEEKNEPKSEQELKTEQKSEPNTPKIIVLTTLRLKENLSYRPAEETLARIVLNNLNLKHTIIEHFEEKSHINSYLSVFSGKLPYLYFDGMMISCTNLPEFLLKLVYSDEKKEAESLQNQLREILFLCRESLRSLNESSIYNQAKLRFKSTIKNNELEKLFDKNNVFKEIILLSKVTQYAYQANDEAERQAKVISNSLDSQSINAKRRISIKDFKFNSLSRDSIVNCYSGIIELKERVTSPYLHIVIYSYLKDDELIYGDKNVRYLVENDRKAMNMSKDQLIDKTKESYDEVLLEIGKYMEFISENIIKKKGFYLAVNSFIKKYILERTYLTELSNCAVSLEDKEKSKEKKDIVEYQAKGVFWHNVFSLSVFLGFGGLIFFLSRNKKQ